jgi:hypothetical protein
MRSRRPSGNEQKGIRPSASVVLSARVADAQRPQHDGRHGDRREHRQEDEETSSGHRLTLPCRRAERRGV